MAFSALEALQAFGAGRQMAQQDRTQRRAEDTYQRSERERSDLSAAYDTTTGNFDPARTRQAYAKAGDIEGAQAFEQHMTALHGSQWTQARDRIIAAPAFLANVTDEASFQRAIANAHAQGVDLANVPAHYDPAWVRDIVTLGNHLQAQQHYQPPTAFQQDATSAGFVPGTPEYRDLAERHLAQPRIQMVDGQPMLVGSAGSGPAAAPQEAVNPQTGERLRLNPQTNQWEPVAAGGPASQAPGGF